MKLIIDLTSKESTLEATEDVKVPLTGSQLLSVLTDAGILKNALARSMRSAAGRDEDDTPKAIRLPPKRSHKKKFDNITALSTEKRHAVKAAKKVYKTQMDPNSSAGRVRSITLDALKNKDMMSASEIKQIVHDRYPEVTNRTPAFVFLTLGDMVEKRMIKRTGKMGNYQYHLK